MVFEEKPRRALASIWSEAVENGTGLERVPSVFSTFSTRNLAFLRRFKIFSASGLELGMSFSRMAGNSGSPNLPVILKLDFLLNFSISRSFSTTRRKAGDWTRPAEMAPGTFFLTTLERSNPTSMSRVWRACWLATMSMSTVRG